MQLLVSAPRKRKWWRRVFGGPDAFRLWRARTILRGLFQFGSIDMLILFCRALAHPFLSGRGLLFSTCSAANFYSVKRSLSRDAAGPASLSTRRCGLISTGRHDNWRVQVLTAENAATFSGHNWSFSAEA